MEIVEATEVTTELVDAMARLVPQLSSTSPPPSHDDLATIVDSDSTRLLLAHDGGRIIGALTLVLTRIPTGLRARIEDVVVDSEARRGGVGHQLNKAAIDLAYAVGARTIDLTSRPSREAAHRLYDRLGFEIRDTAVYRHRGPDAVPDD